MRHGMTQGRWQVKLVPDQQEGAQQGKTGLLQVGTECGSTIQS